MSKDIVAKVDPILQEDPTNSIHKEPQFCVGIQVGIGLVRQHG